MRYLAIAFAAGVCAGWFLRRLRSRNDGDLPPLLFVAISIVAELLSGACGAGPAQGVSQPLRRAWTLEQQVSECRRHAFNGQVGSDTRAVKAFVSLARARWDFGAGAATYAALRCARHGKPRRAAVRR